MIDSKNSPKPAGRAAWIEARTAELLAAGWKSPELAAKRATREWKTHSPQHAAAAKRNAAMSAARTERLDALHPADVMRVIVDGMVVLS